MFKYATVTLSCVLAALSNAENVPTTDSAEEPGLLTIDLDLLDTASENYFKEFGVTLTDGKEIRFSVGGNPTTGFMWTHSKDCTNGAFTVEEAYHSNITPEQID